MARVWHGAVALAGCCLMGAPAIADIIRFEFFGTISTVQGSAPAPVSVGDPFRFTYVFDSDTMDTDPSPNFGLYPAISEAIAQVGMFSHSASFGEISVLDNGIAGDTYHASFTDPLVLAGVNLGQLGGSVFMSDELPDDLDLSVFDFRDFFVEQQVGPASWEARGSIDRFRRTIVPAPAGLAAFGLAGAAFLRRRRARAGLTTGLTTAGESHDR